MVYFYNLIIYNLRVSVYTYMYGYMYIQQVLLFSINTSNPCKKFPNSLFFISYLLQLSSVNVCMIGNIKILKLLQFIPFIF